SGQDVTFFAVVGAAAPGAGTPTTTVSFYDNGNFLGDGTLDGNGIASVDTTALTAGDHTISADYAGDDNFNTGSASFDLTVDPDTTTTTIAPDANPSQFGQDVTYTVDVSADVPGSGTPTGTVHLIVDGNEVGSDTLVNGQVDLTASGLSK